MSDVQGYLSALEQVITEASPAECPALIGELERLKARAWAKLTARGIGATAPGPGESPYLTLEEAAAFLKVSLSTLYHNRTIPRYHVTGPGSGRRSLRFDRRELEAHVRARLVPLSTSAHPTTAEDPAVRAPAAPLDPARAPEYHRNPRYRDHSRVY